MRLPRTTLGNALFEQGRTEEAIVRYREALRINPGYATAHTNLGYALFNQRQIEEAVAEYREALRIDPATAEARNDLGVALLEAGSDGGGNCPVSRSLEDQSRLRASPLQSCQRPVQATAGEDAIAEYREALRIDPAYVNARQNLGNALFKQGRTDEAIAEFREALRIIAAGGNAGQSTGPGNANILYMLAVAYAQTGDFPNALKTAQDALKLADAQSNPILAGMLHRKIKLYRGGGALIRRYSITRELPRIKGSLIIVLGLQPPQPLRPRDCVRHRPGRLGNGYVLRHLLLVKNQRRLLPPFGHFHCALARFSGPIHPVHRDSVVGAFADLDENCRGRLRITALDRDKIALPDVRHAIHVKLRCEPRRGRRSDVRRRGRDGKGRPRAHSLVAGLRERCRQRQGGPPPRSRPNQTVTEHEQFSPGKVALHVHDLGPD